MIAMIRTTVFHLLVHMTDSSLAIQNIVAFDETFSKLLRIAGEEGWVRGGAVVQDIVLLLRNLLKKNANNQRMFVSTGHVGQLAKLMELTDHATANEIGIVNKVIEIVLALANTEEHLHQLHPLSNALLELTASHHLGKQNLGPNDSEDLLAEFSKHRLECLEAFAKIVEKNDKVVENFPSYTITIRYLEPSSGAEAEGQIQRVSRQISEYFLDLAVGSAPCPVVPAPHLLESRKAREVLEGYLRGNSQGQILFASMILNSQARSGSAFGKLLGDILCLSTTDSQLDFGDPQKFETAISILTAILLNNQDTKTLFLDLKIQNDLTLVEIMSGSLLKAVEQKAEIRYICAIFRVLCTWCQNSEKAIQTLFEKSPDLFTLVSTLPTSQPQSNQPLLKGLPCVLLSFCCDYAATLSFAGPPGFIRDVIERQVGLDTIKRGLRDLADELHNITRTNAPASEFFDKTFATTVNDLITTIDSRFVKLLSSTPQLSQSQSLDGGPTLNASAAAGNRQGQLERENAELKAKVQELQTGKKEKKKKMKELVNKLLEVSQEHDRYKNRCQELEEQLRSQAAGSPIKLPQAMGSPGGGDTVPTEQYQECLKNFNELTEEHEDLLVLVSEMDEELEQLRALKMRADLGVPTSPGAEVKQQTHTGGQVGGTGLPTDNEQLPATQGAPLVHHDRAEGEPGLIS